MNHFFATYKNHYKALIYLGIPIIIGQIGVIVLGFADTYMIGQHNAAELAAAAFVNSIFGLTIIFNTGFAYGLPPIVGNFYGKNELNSIGHVVKNSLWANTLVALLTTLIMTVLYLCMDLLGQPPQLLPLMKPYYLALLLSIVFVGFFNCFKQFADGITDTRTPMWILVGGNLLNIIGNYILIYGKFGFPELGIFGAGISTLFSRIVIVIAAVLIFSFSKRYKIYRVGFKRAVLNKTDFFTLNKIGWPIALQMGMETSSFSLSGIMIGWIGETALAAHQIMLSISQICFLMYYGMGAAIAIRVSNFKGKNDLINVRQSTYAGFHIIMVMAVFASIPIYLLRNHLGDFFTNSPEVSTMVASLIIPLLLYQFGDGLQIAFANALRGISDVRPMMVMAFIAYFIISLPLGYFCAFILKWEAFGIWMAFPFGLTSAGIMFYLRFRKKTKTKFVYN